MCTGEVEFKLSFPQGDDGVPGSGAPQPALIPESVTFQQCSWRVGVTALPGGFWMGPWKLGPGGTEGLGAWRDIRRRKSQVWRFPCTPSPQVLPLSLPAR